MLTEALYRRYAELKRDIARLEEELKGLQPRIIEELKPRRDARLMTSFGEFTVHRKANWTYSEAVLGLAEQLKSRQDAEKQNGAATVRYTEYVRFKSPAVAAKSQFAPASVAARA